MTFPPSKNLRGPGKIRLVARGSPLSRIQAKLAEEAIRSQVQNVQFEEQWITTHGDRTEKVDLRGQSSVGVFEREVDEEVIAGRADVAVHSLKDLPPALPAGLSIVAVTDRGPPGDMLVGRKTPPPLDQLPPGTRVGTSSPRRQAMVKFYSRDVVFVPMRGNVGTRLDKLMRGECDVLVMAEAGAYRLGREVQATRLSPLDFPPAPGQGIIAMVARKEMIGQFVAHRLATQPSWDAMLAERAFLKEVGGGCSKPLGGYYTPHELLFAAVTWKEEGDARKSVRVQGQGMSPEGLGIKAAKELASAAWEDRP